jgi:hypothetical protein
MTPQQTPRRFVLLTLVAVGVYIVAALAGFLQRKLRGAAPR